MDIILPQLILLRPQLFLNTPWAPIPNFDASTWQWQWGRFTNHPGFRKSEHDGDSLLKSVLQQTGATHWINPIYFIRALQFSRSQKLQRFVYADERI